MESESGEINVLNFHWVSCFDVTKDHVCKVFYDQKIFTFLMKTLPEAQRTQSIDFITSITFLTEINLKLLAEKVTGHQVATCTEC